MRGRRWTVMAMAVATLAVTAAPAAADTFTVNSTADDNTSTCNPGDTCELREAISLAGDHPGSTVVVPANTYTLTRGELLVPDQTTVQGAGARTTIIDAGTASRVISASGTVVLSRLTVRNGTDNTGPGGDILQSGGDLTLDHVHVTLGNSTAGGAGIANVNGALTVTHSLIDHNVAGGTGNGGGILSQGASGSPATLRVTDSTITGNTAGGDGGGIEVEGDNANDTTLEFTTIASNGPDGNPATGGGGLVVQPSSGTVHIGASILAGNTSGGPVTNCDAGTIDDTGANVESGTDCGFTDTAAGDRQNADPRLGPLGNQGGETDVLPLGAGSPAIDLAPAAACADPQLATDQRDRGRPQGPGCDAGAFEADAVTQPGPPPPPPPPPPPAPAPHAHSLVGAVQYVPPYNVGASYSFVLNPFSVHPNPLPEIALVAADGTVVARQRLNPLETYATYALYRIDGLGACQSCTVQLRDIHGFQDSQPVSFDGQDGQTDAYLLETDRPGGIVAGSVFVPREAVRPEALSVRIFDGGRVIADTATLRPRCAPNGTPGLRCPGNLGYDYELTGVPPVTKGDATAVLYQQGMTRATPSQPSRPIGPLVAVDSVSVRLDFSSSRGLGIPQLTALDAVPSSIHGRSVYGDVSYLPPYAPGDTPNTARLTRAHQTVGLYRGSQQVAVATVTSSPRDASPGYVLRNLPRCDGCTLELRDGPRIVDRSTVTVAGGPGSSVVRRDLQFRDVNGNFLDGQVSLPSDVRPDHVRVIVRSTGVKPRILADSSRLPRACRPVSGPGHCLRGQVGFRLGGMPPDTPVVVTLEASVAGPWQPVDSQAVTTSPDDQDTFVPTLRLLPGVGRRDPGLQLVGSVVRGGAFAPGVDALEIPARTRYQVRLLDPAGAVLARTTVDTREHATPVVDYQFVELKTCLHCTLELVGSRGVEDQEPVDVAGQDPSVAEAPALRTDQKPGGPYLEGGIFAPRAIRPTDVVVQVRSGTGRVIASTRDRGVLQPACASARGGCAARQGGFAYRLGHMPAGRAVTVAVVDRRGRRLASGRVTVDPGGGDTGGPSLQLGAPRP